MEIYDGHIHTRGVKSDPPEVFHEKALSSGVCGGTVFSVHPARYRPFPDFDQRAKSRIDAVMEFTSRAPGFLPYFFADLSEPDIIDQIEYARKAGIRGFKVICDGRYSAADRIDAVAAMAETGLPVMFHSGIDNVPHVSSKNNVPSAFEPLLHVKGLRFSLAHIGWPWCDDFVGTFAKFEMARDFTDFGPVAEMFADVTPGTPGIYREEAMRKLYLAGFHAKDRTFWGTDQIVNDYAPSWTKWLFERDTAILAGIEREAKAVSEAQTYWLPKLENLAESLFSTAWRRFNAI